MAVDSILSDPRIKALIEEYQPSRVTYAVWTGWEIMLKGTELKQRTFLMNELEDGGLPSSCARFVAGECPVDLLPDGDVVEALAVLDSLGGGDDDNYIFDGVIFTRSNIKVDYEVWNEAWQ